MVHKIIGTNIFIQTSQAGINLFNAQEKDIQEYSEILNYIIVLNRKLSNSIESASKESEKRILSHYRKLQDRYAFWLFNILETGEIAKQLFLADNDIAKIIYINQYSISSCKILEKFKYDIGFYNTIFNVDENNAPYKALNCFYDAGGNLAASNIRNLECPSYEVYLIDYGCGKFNKKVHIME